MENKLLFELEYMANKYAKSENEDDKRIASILYAILGAYYSGTWTLAELTGIISYYSKKAIQGMNDKKASLN